MRVVSTVIGALLVLAGVVFGLQGIGLIKGSVMTGTLTWTILGPLIALVGVGLIVYGVRRAAKAS